MINSGFASTYLYRLIRQTRHATVAGDVTGVMTSMCCGLFNHSFLVHTSNSAQALDLHLPDVRNTLRGSNDTRSAIRWLLTNNLTLMFSSLSHRYWAVKAGLLTPLTFARHSLSPLAAFTSVRTFFTMEGGDSEFVNFTMPTLKAFFWGT